MPWLCYNNAFHLASQGTKADFIAPLRSPCLTVELDGRFSPVTQSAAKGTRRMSNLGHESSNSRSSMGSEFLKIFGGGKRVTRDGQPPKRRGPKPDTRPAASRRQELNRQAQRSHRERKEQYMRALEVEVSRLREAYGQDLSAANVSVQQHKQKVQTLSDENEILKGILSAHGIPFEADLERYRAERAHPGQQSSPFSSHTPSTHITSASHPFTTTPPTSVSPNSVSPPINGTMHAPAFNNISPTQAYSTQVNQISNSPAMDVIDRSGQSQSFAEPVQAIGGIFETDPQLQIDFVLTLEGPCREHTDFLCRRSVAEADDENMPFSGHALMATCPPPSYIANTTNEQPYPHKTYDLPVANLNTLLNLSRQVVNEGQITPIMALQCLKNHELYHTLTREDVHIIIETLNTSVRCYGFGACVEDFELMDCFRKVLGSKVQDVGFSQLGDDAMYS
ncbi:hypothetical protein PHISCL_08915 [Aspergillus sclerotialis]|uniref:Uncharacterized protein n=1 Tax=Aspergillus sclerotialis TaxID=2070753 RepID=A0A3A2ZNT3_9EURO|nr:hypothetical protein PHISCL_08915 [Aspergillus sclerotialis]